MLKKSKRIKLPLLRSIQPVADLRAADQRRIKGAVQDRSDLRRLSDAVRAAAGPTADPEQQLPVFTRAAVITCIDNLNPAALGISQKSLANVGSACARMADWYAIEPVTPVREPLPPAAAALVERLATKFERIYAGYLLRVLAQQNMSPPDISDDFVPTLQAAIEADPRVKHKKRKLRLCLRAWNRCVESYPWWPQIRLTRPEARVIWGRPWNFFPATFKESIDLLFERATGPVSVGSKLPAMKGRAPATIAFKQRALRVAACALHYSDVPPEAIDHWRVVCAPDTITTIGDYLIDRHGAVNTNVAQTVSVLVGIARVYAGLNKKQLASVKIIADNLAARHRQFLKSHPDRDAAAVDMLDDPLVCDALLSLGSRMLDEVRRGIPTSKVRQAYRLACALMLELWLCLPLRLKNMSSLRIDLHFFFVMINGRRRVVVRIPGSETKTGEPIEAFLNDDAAALLDIFIKDYRRHIVEKNSAGDSQLLFPGRDGAVRDPSTVQMQMKRFVKDGTGIPFHPHLIRKLMPRIILDIDPGAMEVVRRAGGWKNFDMLHKIYGPKNHRVSQEKYNDLLESRRLSALGVMQGKKRRGGKRG